MGKKVYRADQIAEYLLRNQIRFVPLREDFKQHLANEAEVEKGTIDKYLSLLEKRGALLHTYLVNRFATKFCHEFCVSVKVNISQVRSQKFTIEKFIEKVVEDSCRNEQLSQHLLIVEAVILHGASDRDVEFTVLTDDGIASVSHFVCEDLSLYDFVSDPITSPVRWRYSFNAYSGRRIRFSNGVEDSQEKMMSEEAGNGSNRI